VSQFSVREEVAEQELLLKDHFFSPVGVDKSSVLSKGGKSTDIKEDKENTSSASGNRFIMRGNLFWSSEVVQELIVLLCSIDKWVDLSVIWVDVSLLHAVNSSLIVTLSVFLLVGGVNSSRSSSVRQIGHSCLISNLKLVFNRSSTELSKSKVLDRSYFSKVN
jgi:hypothetical protein